MLEILATDSAPNFKSRRYDRRRLNGNRRFGEQMAARRRSLACDNDSVAKSAEGQLVGANEQADRIVRQMKELSRIRYGN